MLLHCAFQLCPHNWESSRIAFFAEVPLFLPSGHPSAPVHLPSSLFLPTSHLNLQREPPWLLTSPLEPSGFHLPLYCNSSMSLNLSGRDIVHIPEPGGMSSGCSYRVLCVRTVSVPASRGAEGKVRHSSSGEGKQGCGFWAGLLPGGPITCQLRLPHKICLQRFWLPELMDSTPLHKPHS